MKKTPLIVMNILATVVLAVVAAEFGLQLLCLGALGTYCGMSPMVYVALAVTFVVLLRFSITQFIKTHGYIKPKPKSTPIPAKLSTTFNFIKKTIWEADFTQQPVVPVVDARRFGWCVECEDKVIVIVDTRQFYYWLVEVVTIQEELKQDGKRRVSSPVSQRWHVGALGYRRWRVYVQLLQEAGALLQLNSNVSVLRNEFVSNPELIIDNLKQIRGVQILS